MRQILFILLLILSIDIAWGQDFVRFHKIINYDEEDKPLALTLFVYVDRSTDEIYLIDSRNRIIIYDSTFYPLLTLDRRRGIVAPLALSLDSDGNLYVIQAPSKKAPGYRISVYNPALLWERDIYIQKPPDTERFAPLRIAIDRKGDLYITGSNYPGALVVDPYDGHIKKIISPQENGEKVPISNVNIDSHGNIYLLSAWISRVFVYDSEGRFLYKFGKKGGVTGKLSQPQTVVVDEARNFIYIVDYMRHSVSAFSRRGKFLFEFGGKGWGEGWFAFPKYIDIDSRGRVMVADMFNKRLQVFVPVGGGVEK